MLKFDVRLLIFVILFLQIELSEAVGYVMPILCGLSIFTGSEVKNRTLTARGFLIKILYISGLCPMAFHILRVWRPNWDITISLFIVTLLTDTIVTHGFPVLSQWVLGIIQKLINNKNTTKNE